MRPSAEIKQSSLVDATGFVDVDKDTLQHKKYQNVFALGDCSNLPTSKTMAAIAAQNKVLADNLKSVMSHQPLTSKVDFLFTRIYFLRQWII